MINKTLLVQKTNNETINSSKSENTIIFDTVIYNTNPVEFFSTPKISFHNNVYTLGNSEIAYDSTTGYFFINIPGIYHISWELYLESSIDTTSHKIIAEFSNSKLLPSSYFENNLIKGDYTININSPISFALKNIGDSITLSRTSLVKAFLNISMKLSSSKNIINISESVNENLIDSISTNTTDSYKPIDFDSFTETKVSASSSKLYSDYMEYYESLDSNPIDPGYFVTLDGDKIKIATSDDLYILGVTTIKLSYSANSSEFYWKNKFLTDSWGQIIYEESSESLKPVINPDYDDAKEYIPRSQRLEWIPVGLIGQLLVRDDGSCNINGYCMPNENGIATNSNSGYRVLKRLSYNQILIIFR